MKGIPPPLTEYDVSKKAQLEILGFHSLGSWGGILKDGLPGNKVLSRHGVYSILRCSDRPPDFFTEIEAKANKNVIKPFSFEILKKRWVPRVDVVYFGAAGVNSERTLKERLNDLLGHCLGTKHNHKGGEILWQLKDYRAFVILALPTQGTPIPRAWECSLNTRFLQINGKLPYANAEAWLQNCGRWQR